MCSVVLKIIYFAYLSFLFHFNYDRNSVRNNEPHQALMKHSVLCVLSVVTLADQLSCVWFLTGMRHSAQNAEKKDNFIFFIVFIVN